METKRGKLFVLEGIECVGKTSILNHLKEMYPDAIFTREPGGTPIAEDLRTYIFQNADKMAPETEAMLFYAARIEHVLKVIQPALDAGKHVFTDRYYWSTLAYQTALKENSEFVEDLHWQFFNKRLPKPWLTIWLDASVETMLDRKLARGIVHGEEVNKLEDRDRRTFSRIREKFQALSGMPLSGIVRVDAEQDLDKVISDCVGWIGHRMVMEDFCERKLVINKEVP